MSNIPPFQMGDPQGGPPQKSTTNVWLWVVLGLAGTCLLCGVIGAAVLFPLFAQARQSAKLSGSLSGAKSVATSLAIYMSDFDDRFPPMDNGPSIVEKIKPYVKSTRLETLAKGYEWNTALSRLDTKNIENSPELWMFVATQPSDIKREPVAFVDTHVKIIKREEIPTITAVRPKMSKP